MIWHELRRAFTAVFTVGLIYSCAQIGSLSGGDKDISPPALVRSNPDTFQTNFNAQKIKIDFNEFIQLDNPKKNLLITPLLRYDPVVTTSGKSLIIRNLDDSLWPNTTYVMEFNEGIKDITEQNPATGFRYVFSTGDYVDSLAVSGYIWDAFTLKVVENAFVFFYDSFEDSLPYLSTPRYIGRTNKLGSFTVGNMKPGSYKAFACSDENRNFKYNLTSEKIDFAPDKVNVTSDSSGSLNFFLYQEESESQYLKGYGSLSRWSWYLSFNTPVDSILIKSLGAGEGIDTYFARSYNTDHDSVVFWAIDSTFPDFPVKLVVETEDTETDTIDLEFQFDPVPAKLRFNAVLEGNRLDLGEDLVFNSEFPIAAIDESKITLLRDSIVEKFNVQSNSSKRRITISASWQESSKYLLILDSMALTDIAGRVNDSTVIEFITPKQTFYGTLELKLGISNSRSGILIVMDEGEKEIERVVMSKTNTHYFPHMHPGVYMLKYIADWNENRKWDPGSYLQGLRPEDVKVYSGTITIRSNWDQVIEWKFN